MSFGIRAFFPNALAAAKVHEISGSGKRKSNESIARWWRFKRLGLRWFFLRIEKKATVDSGFHFENMKKP
jgi:hypothetical protein